MKETVGKEHQCHKLKLPRKRIVDKKFITLKR